MRKKKEIIYELLIEEWKDLREEVHMRVEQTDKYTEFSLLVVGAYIAFYNSITDENRIVLVGFPLVLYALIFLTVRSDYIILDIVQYSNIDLRKKIERIVSCNKNLIFQWEYFRYKNDLSKKKIIRHLSIFLTGVRFGIPFLATVIISLLYLLKFGFKNTTIDMIVMGFFLFGTILFIFVMFTWIPYCQKSYKDLFL